ncbi:MAG: LUD domain-containing protein [Burkholderiales bacterium]|nr:LUD domain-containing protein [Phycisphaerae bacterium]
MNDPHNVIGKVSRSLGRSAPPATVPDPPALQEPLIRLVLSDIGLPALFEKRAKENKIGVTPLRVESLHEELIGYLKARRVKSIALPNSKFLNRLEIPRVLREAGFIVSIWDQMTLDQLYDVDASVTDVWRVVAETGSLVLRASPEHGRALSLVPQIHVAIVEPKNCVGDLIDLFELTTREGSSSATVIISGPSKTADIEMNLVTGVHGPGVVQVFLLK